MNIKIEFKQIVLKQGLLVIIILGLLFSTMLMLFTTFSVFINYMISLISMIIMIIVLFYLNRNVPEQIILDKSNIAFQYYNKLIFRNRTKTYTKDELSFKIRRNVLVIKNKDTKVAEISKKALKSEEWKMLIGLITN